MGSSTQAERTLGATLAVAVQQRKPFQFDAQAAFARGAMQASPAIESMMLTLMIKGNRLLDGVHNMRGITQECSREQYQMIVSQTHRIRHMPVKELMKTIGLAPKQTAKGHP